MRNMQRESAPNYNYVLLQPTDNERLIECRDNYQWILQTFTGMRWRSKSYVTSKATLIRLFREISLPVGGLEHFPENFRTQFMDGERAIWSALDPYPTRSEAPSSDHAPMACEEVSDD